MAHGAVTDQTDVAHWIGAVRRRQVAVSVCLAALAAAAVNESVRWAMVAAISLSGRKFVLLDVGPLFLAALFPFLARRWNAAAAARLADARLGLSDRLASFVDFAARNDVTADVRGAQARETSRALVGVRPAAAAPLRVWLAAGPLLLLASLVYPYFIFSGTQTVTTQVIRRIGVALRPGGFAGGDMPAPATAPAEGTALQGAPQPERAQDPPAALRGDTPPREEKPLEARSAGAAAGPGGEAAGEQGNPAAARSPAGPLEGGDPGVLVSERVGKKPARVVNPVYSPGTGTQPPPPRMGTISVDIVPRGGRGKGRDDAPGAVELPERVKIDLDALPEQYRPLVKSYFELLAAGAPAGERAVKAAERSRIP